MFRGINTVNLDIKGRLAIPTRYRARLANDAGGQLIVTIDTEERCLLLYPMPEWEQIEAKIESLPSFNRVTRRIQRLLIGHATEVELDKNGRILVSPELRGYAGLEKRVALVGQGKKFEIWGERQWDDGRESWLSVDSDGEMTLPEELQSLSL